MIMYRMREMLSLSIALVAGLGVLALLSTGLKQADPSTPAPHKIELSITIGR